MNRNQNELGILLEDSHDIMRYASRENWSTFFRIYECSVSTPLLPRELHRHIQTSKEREEVIISILAIGLFIDV
jgi:hypothetical protein